MRLPLPTCLLNRHSPNRAAVRWDGYSYVGECRWCGERIRRKEHKLWHKEWREEA
ncbi:MAG: hypothetical protein KDE55_07920 [Novosphingobium sp.]|nr:hypothetical protein [Novosphingobium sp.]